MKNNTSNASGAVKKILPDWYLKSRLKMRHVLLLVALDEHRNMHKAASSVSMTQPAASRLLGDLERLLEVRLFDRNSRGIYPNAYGESLIRHARRILVTLDYAREEINSISSGTTGRTSVGTLLIAAPTLVPDGVARFKLKQPNHTVHLREGNTATLIPALWRGELDFIVGRASAGVLTEGVRFEALYEETMCVISRTGHRLARRRSLTMASLANEAWILPTIDSVYRGSLDEAFRAGNAEPPKCIVESLSPLSNMDIIRRTDMLAVMPFNVAKHYAQLGEVHILPVKPPALSGPVGIITLAGRQLTHSANDLVGTLREAAIHYSKTR